MHTTSPLIDLTSYPKLVFKENVMIFNDVLFLYQNHENCQFQYLIGNKKVTQENIDTFQINIDHNVTLSKKHNFLYKHIVFPAKPTCFKPRFKNLGIEIRPLFSKAHEHSAVYYPPLQNIDFHKEDTHCNILGDLKIMFVVLAELYPHITLPNPILKKNIVHLDLAEKIHDNYTGTEVQVIAGFNNIITRCTKSYSLNSALHVSSGTIIYKKNPYAYYKQRLLLFGDSCFQQIMFDIFTSLFTEVLFFRNPYVMEDIIQCYEPDVVLSGNAERYLIAVPNSSRPIPWFMHYLSANRFNSQKVSQKDFMGLLRLFTEKRIYKKS